MAGGVGADPQAVRDRTVGAAFSEEQRHLDFARRHPEFDVQIDRCGYRLPRSTVGAYESVQLEVVPVAAQASPVRAHLEDRRPEASHQLAGFGSELLVAQSQLGQLVRRNHSVHLPPSRRTRYVWGMAAIDLTHLRRALALRGLTPASAVPEASGGRIEEACLRPARLIEDATLAWHPVGASEPWPGTLAFLDGVQRSELLAYAGPAPIVVGEVAAAVRERSNRKLVTILEERRLLILARPAALAAAGDLPDDFRTVALPADEPPHPVRDLANAGRALDRARGALELELGERYRHRSEGWLVVDGALTESPRWAADPRMLGVSTSHATLPFDGEDLDRYLRLPPGHRSSVYAPETRSLTPVHEWALRLWPWEGKDVFYGLLRIEVAPANGAPEVADRLSRWLLAERAPLSSPDHRWDRLLYGIHSVEAYLRAGGRRLA